MMPEFSGLLNQAQRQQIAAYVASLQAAASRAATRPLPLPNATQGGPLVGDPRAGEALFFRDVQTHSCVVCHSFNRKGGHVGPDLAPRVTGLSPKQLFERIVMVPHRVMDPEFAPIRVRTRDGRLITGITESETADVLRLYDTGYLPPLLVTIPKADVLDTSRVNMTVMPKDYASRFTLQQLLDLVAFLKSGTGAQAPVRLADVIDLR